jgi:hyperosmotically inducible protein
MRHRRLSFLDALEIFLRQRVKINKRILRAAHGPQKLVYLQLQRCALPVLPPPKMRLFFFVWGPVLRNAESAGNESSIWLIFKAGDKTMRKICGVTFVLGLAIPGLFAQNPPTQPDNSAVNQQDRQKGAVTADQQKGTANDRTLTQQIRRSLVKDKSLSTYAHNVKVVSQNGVVTLKGPVRSEEEKRSVEAKAAEIAGRDNVRSEISVAPKPAENSR